MIAIALWQSLLDGFGWCLAQIYSIVPNYALAIIILTILIRLLLLPFTVKQIKSAQHMQALQPELAALKKKYKNNKEKLQQEQMRLYREAGANPLGGCLPLLLTLPFLFAMYAVIKPPTLQPVTDAAGQKTAYVVINNHLPEDSELFQKIVTHQDLNLANANLQCSLATAGTQVQLKDSTGQQIQEGLPILAPGDQALPFDAVSQSTLNCGDKKFPDAIPYVVLLVLMLLSALYMQRQLTKANPPGPNAGPQQAIMKYMPLIYVVWGWQFPAGLVLYWTTANAIQVAQQTFMLRAGHIGPDAIERKRAETKARLAEGGPPKKKGIMGWISDKAQSAQQQQEQIRKQRPDQGAANRKPGQPKPGQQKSGQRNSKQGQRKQRQGQAKPSSGQTKPSQGQPKPAQGQGQANAERDGVAPTDGQPSADGQPPTDGKPVKGAKPGNQLRPKKKS